MKINLILFLPFLTIFTGVDFLVGSSNVRMDHLFVVLLFVILLIKIYLNKSKYFYLAYPGLALSILWLISLISSFNNAPDVKYSVTQSINLITVGLAYFLISNELNSIDLLKIFLRNSFIACCILSVIGTVFFLISLIIKYPLYGINIEQSEFVPFGIYLTMKEPNIYGSFMMIYFLISFSIFSSGTSSYYGFSKLFIITVLILSGAGVLLSFTRGVWLATIICLSVFYFRNIKNISMQLPRIIIVVALVFIFYYVTLNFWGITFFKYKIDNFLNVDSESAAGRLIFWYAAMDNWIAQQNLWLGNGTYSFASFFNNGGYESDSNAWIGNFLITYIHDTGILGTLSFVFFIYYLLRQKKAEKKSRNFNQSSLLLGLQLSAIAILITYIFTSAFSYTYPWILFGLITASKRIFNLTALHE